MRGDHHSLAQSFTTGSSDGGYTLGSIKFIFKNHFLQSAAGDIEGQRS